ncbi:MAG: NAD(+)/NADH kinase [Fimbriimonas sp.]
MRVNLVTNTFRDDAIAAAAAAARWLTARGATVGIDRDAATKLDLPVVEKGAFSDADLIVAFGGDGTVIRAAHLAADGGTPVLGVYYGRFGFVTQCTGEDVEQCLQDFIDGKHQIERRMMLDAQLFRGGQPVTRLTALNEAVLQRDVNTRMMTFRIVVDGNVLTSYPADGVLIATPTGSTAYNLSAGGPIMDPQVEALMLTAIAPHTLNARTLVFRPDAEILLQVRSHGDAVLSADGQTRLHLLSGDEVRVTRSPRVTNLVSVDRNDFLVKLNQRLLWSQGLTGADV